MSNRTKALVFQASFLVLALPALARAEDPTQVMVTITRQPLPVDKVGQAVDVLTDKDIKSYQSLFVGDLLTHTTDLSLTRNGGPGQTASASLRGAGADHTLYLVDGIALNDPSQTGGGTDLGLLMTEDASRIEVLRGPLSTLWGSGALGGVVSIATRQATQPLQGDIAVEGFDRYGSARAGLGGKVGALTWRLFAGGQNDQGVSAYDQGTEKDGFAETHLGADLGYNLSDTTTLKVLSIKTHTRSDFDGFPPPNYTFADTADFGKTDTTLTSAALINRFGQGEQTLSLSETESKRAYDNPDHTPNFLAVGRIESADYHLLYNLNANDRLLGGLKYERDEMRESSPSSFDPDPPALAKSTTTGSVYSQYSHDFAGGASFAVSARHDNASSFGGEDLAQVSLVVPVSDHWRFHASAGQGVKVPGLYQLYSDYGNGGLRPEKGLTMDGGADYSFTGGSVSATVFTRTVRDLIDFGASGCTMAQLFGCYGNIARSKASGVELEYRQDLSDTLHLRGNYSVLDTRNDSAAVSGQKLRLPHTPKDMGSVDLGYDATASLNLGLGVRHVGQSFDDTLNTTTLKAYTLVDLRADYRLNDTVDLYGRIENAGDARYETAAGYGQLGRRLWLGIRAQWQ